MLPCKILSKYENVIRSCFKHASEYEDILDLGKDKTFTTRILENEEMRTVGKRRFRFVDRGCARKYYIRDWHGLILISDIEDQPQ